MKSQKAVVEVPYTVQGPEKYVIDLLKESDDSVPFSEIKEYVEEEFGLDNFTSKELQELCNRGIVEKVFDGDFGPCGCRELKGYELNSEVKIDC